MQPVARSDSSTALSRFMVRPPKRTGSAVPKPTCHASSARSAPAAVAWGASPTGTCDDLASSLNRMGHSVKLVSSTWGWCAVRQRSTPRFSAAFLFCRCRRRFRRCLNGRLRLGMGLLGGRRMRRFPSFKCLIGEAGEKYRKDDCKSCIHSRNTN